MRIVNVKDYVIIPLGKQGENLATRVLFPFADEWRLLFGDGTFQLLHQRQSDAEPHAVTVGVDGENVVWNVENVDVAVPGVGKCELNYLVGGALAKSITYSTKTAESLSDVGDTPPEPWESWIEEVLQAGSQAQESANSASASATVASAAAIGATTAKTAAETAAANAASAKTAAETARTAAQAAASSAVSAKTAAETAATSAAESAEEIEDLTVSASGLPAGSTPIVTKTGGGGTPYNLAFGIPKGADGSPGADGITPTIGNNGNWFLGDTDTGKPSRGQQGERGSDAAVTAENIEAALGYVPADEEELDAKQDTITDLATIRTGAGKGATALQPPASGLAVNKYFRVASVDPLTLEAVDAPDAAMKIKLDGTAQTPGSDGYVDIPTCTVNSLLPGMFTGASPNTGNDCFENSSWAGQKGITIRKLSVAHLRSRYTGMRGVVGTSNFDQAVKIAMCDPGTGTGDDTSKPLIWTDAEKTGAWSRLNSIKSTMDAVAVAGAKYFLGEQTAVSITMPTDALLGQAIEVNFASGATAATLTCDLTGFDFTPKANTTNKLTFTLIHKSAGTGDEDQWSVEVEEG